MKTSDVKKMLLSNGLSPIGIKDELVMRLSSGGISDEEAVSKPTSSTDFPGASLIKDIIDNGGSDNAAILSLSKSTITANSSKPEMRKAYLKLSLKIHPDKNGGSSDSKAAFQILVQALELLSNPPSDDDEGGPRRKRRKPTRVSRGNTGCYVTRVECPRCSMEWNRPELGLEKGAYNFFMQGIKQYCCGRCSMKFGCMTAVHKCPICKKTFDYDPDDYHRKITCGNKTGKCSKMKKPFGFWYAKVSERREMELRRQQRAKKKAMRSRSSETIAQQMKKDKWNYCPRCGTTGGIPPGASGERRERLAIEHLSQCNNAEIHEAYRAKLKAQKAKKLEKKNKELQQNEKMMLLQWRYGGRQVGQLWMLSVSQLRILCKEHELSLDDITANEEDLKKSDTANADAKAQYDTSGIAHVDEEDLPSNLWTLERSELANVAASYGVKIKSGDVKETLIHKLEKARFKGTGQLLLES
eukprot:GSMAST32.ASY1.ANO1.2370.1 assembled CDS